MKIRHPLVIRWIAFVGAILIRLYMSSMRYRYRPLGPVYDPWRDQLMPQSIFAFWHENILVPCHQFGHKDFRILVSQHSDGEIIARVLRHVGFGTIRGSTTRGGVKAVRQMISASGNKHLVLIPDGPRGPRRTVEMGLLYLASRTRLPIVVFGVGYSSAWRLRTWDRFAIPMPFSLTTLVTGRPIHVPRDIRKDELEMYRKVVEAEFERVTREAERLAGGRDASVASPGAQMAA